MTDITNPNINIDATSIKVEVPKSKVKNGKIDKKILLASIFGVGGAVAFVSASSVVESEENLVGSSNEALNEGSVTIDTEFVSLEDTVSVEASISVAFADNNATFSSEFRKFRDELGEGGVFQYNGKLYNTFYKEEWEELSPEEISDFFNSIDMPLREVISTEEGKSSPIVIEENTQEDDVPDPSDTGEQGVTVGTSNDVSKGDLNSMEVNISDLADPIFEESDPNNQIDLTKEIIEGVKANGLNMDDIYDEPSDEVDAPEEYNYDFILSEDDLDDPEILETVNESVLYKTEDDILDPSNENADVIVLGDDDLSDPDTTGTLSDNLEILSTAEISDPNTINNVIEVVELTDYSFLEEDDSSNFDKGDDSLGEDLDEEASGNDDVSLDDLMSEFDF